MSFVLQASFFSNCCPTGYGWSSARVIFDINIQSSFLWTAFMYSELAFGDNPIKHAERGRGQLAYWVRDLKLGGGCLYPYSFH